MSPSSAAIIVMCVALAQARAATAQSLDPTTAAVVDSIVSTWVVDNEVVGLQVAIGMGGEVAWNGSYGVADLEHGIPVIAETRFRTASISKWMTATAAMKLVELGQLDLDAPIQRYCRSFPEKQWPLTTRNLLAHRGGVRHYWGANGEDPQTPQQRRELRVRQDEADRWTTRRYDNTVAPLNRFKDDPLLFEPGTDFRYTSFGYRLVGCVLRGAAGVAYNELMHEHVFGPSGMPLTRNDDAYAVIPNRARGYVRSPSGQLRRSKFRDVSENLPAGGHVSTASDLVRFALAWHAGRLVSEESMAGQTAAPVGAESSGYYGFGVTVSSVDDLGGKTVYLHSGSQDETRTWLVLVPESGIAVSTLSNDEDVPPMLQIIWPILNLLDR